jgi:hypothetical protein
MIFPPAKISHYGLVIGSGDIYRCREGLLENHDRFNPKSDR